ncbi:MAG: hypothetical protein Q7K26_04030 [bacterium]|nr:hypothetical protein [bacterium]
MKRDKILILTNSQDIHHADIVIKKIRRKGAKVFRFNVDEMIQGKIRMHVNVKRNKYDCVIKNKKQVLNLREVKSVWNRRPFEHWNFKIRDLDQKRYAEQELKTFLNDIWLTLGPEVFWMNMPENQERAMKKIFQLKLAKELQMRIPETLVTNNPDDVIKFYNKHKNGIIYKPMHIGLIADEKKAYVIQTNLIKKHHLKKLKLITQSPSLFQEHISKKYEMRITVVGKRIFPVKIHSQEFAETKVDFRDLKKILSLKYEPTTIPVDVKRFCFQIIKKLGLVFGAFDFAVTEEDKYVFFEVNPHGQWYWLEEATGVLMSDAIADILINKGR